jgi:hypothetical protein
MTCFFLTKDDFFWNEGGERHEANQPELPDLNLNVSGCDESEDLPDLNFSGNDQPPFVEREIVPCFSLGTARACFSCMALVYEQHVLV